MRVCWMAPPCWRWEAGREDQLGTCCPSGGLRGPQDEGGADVSRARREAKLNLVRTSVDATRSLGHEPLAPGSREALDAVTGTQMELTAAARVLRAALDRKDDEAAERVAKAIQELDPGHLPEEGRKYQAKVAELFPQDDVSILRRVDTLKQDRDVWQHRVDELNGALVDHIVNQRAAVRLGVAVINGRVRGQAIEELV